MNVVIIEDEHLSAQRLETMLKKYDASIQVLAEIPSVAEAVQWFKENENPDLVLMDIHLEDGQSFSIFERINLDVPVIFTTAFDEYTIQAFKVNSVDYLMKPLNYDELVKAIEKYKRIHAEKEESGKSIEQLLQSLHRKEPEYKSRFLISIGSRLMTVETEGIQYFFSADKITFLVTTDGHRYPVDFSLDKLAAMLNPKEFYRINRQMTVKLSAIENIHVFSKGRIKLDLNPPMKEDVFVSLDKVVEFKEWLGK
ncbi:LytR/AlgR family response regulator transcription factor [Flavisolibacter ginsenosidimutans]|uniref:Response regulator transcription factor n=1 Tax=Flavisolibacter ginsenosidimutans TaxID=661481 RepID=A0A5B8UM18_9BACT|nr:LytTR family DNA-binding domain-containing protein [Flavisolibacter ginsenosidimutans]QEC57516.1 response regulator transcription factor [Flavisolibacter ginsenosidimutans]